MTVYGTTTPAASPFALRTNSLILSSATFDVVAPEFLFRVLVPLDGLGVSAADQEVRAVLYTSSGDLVAFGPPVTIAAGSAASARSLSFDESRGRVLPPGSYRAGIHTGPVGSGVRILTGVTMPTRPIVKAGGTAPASGPAIWMNATGDMLEVALTPTGPGGAAHSAVFVQPTAPSHAGPYVWLNVDRKGTWLPGDPVEVTLDTSGAGTPTDDAEVAVTIGAATAGAPHHVAFSTSGDMLVIDAEYAPASSPWTSLPPQRITTVDYSAVSPLAFETIPLTVIPDVDDEYLARLPWDLSQRAFSATGALQGTARAAQAGWYGLKFDPTDGAHAIARTGTALAELVGERIRVQRRSGGRTATVYLYVHDEREFPADFEEDLLLSRRAFMVLASHTAGSVAVRVDTLA